MGEPDWTPFQSLTSRRPPPHPPLDRPSPTPRPPLARPSRTALDNGQILSKFVSIVGDFTDHASGRLKLVDWDSFGGAPAAAAAADAAASGGAASSSGASAAASAPSAVDYFADIDRNVTALHRCRRRCR